MAVDPADVVAGYRLILGREPESAAAVQEKLSLPDVGARRTVLLDSDEFRTGLTALLEDDRIAATRTQAPALYGAMLGRHPEAKALDEIGRERISAARLASRIAQSAEHAARHRERAALAQLQTAPRPPRGGGTGCSAPCRGPSFMATTRRAWRPLRLPDPVRSRRAARRGELVHRAPAPHAACCAWQDARPPGRQGKGVVRCPGSSACRAT